jgi:hypothetical protein
MAAGVETDMGCAAADDGLQVIAPLCFTVPAHLVDPSIQTEVVKQATVMSGAGAQCALVSIPTFRCVVHLSSHILRIQLGQAFN